MLSVIKSVICFCSFAWKHDCPSRRNELCCFSHSAFSNGHLYWYKYSSFLHMSSLQYEIHESLHNVYMVVWLLSAVCGGSEPEPGGLSKQGRVIGRLPDGHLYRNRGADLFVKRGFWSTSGVNMTHRGVYSADPNNQVNLVTAEDTGQECRRYTVEVIGWWVLALNCIATWISVERAF